LQDQLTISELCLDWEDLHEKLTVNSELFKTAVWPALTDAGWQYTAKHLAAAAAPAAADSCDVSAATATAAAAGSEEQRCYLPPATVTAAYVASVGEPLQPCSSWQEVLAALQESGQAVPAAVITSLREAELAEAVEGCLAPPCADAPHHCCHDPSAKRPGTPLTSRKFVSNLQQRSVVFGQLSSACVSSYSSAAAQGTYNQPQTSFSVLTLARCKETMLRS
jgi:hypothetical protein